MLCSVELAEIAGVGYEIALAVEDRWFEGRKVTTMSEQKDQAVSAPAPAKQAGAEANKALVLEFYERVFIGGDVDAADEYMRPDYIQHNPKVPEGLEGFKSYFKKLGERSRRMGVTSQQEISHVVADGDFVAVFGSNKLTGLLRLRYRYGDIYRIQDGRLAEHWDVLQGESLLDDIILALVS